MTEQKMVTLTCTVEAAETFKKALVRGSGALEDRADSKTDVDPKAGEDRDMAGWLRWGYHMLLPADDEDAALKFWKRLAERRMRRIERLDERLSERTHNSHHSTSGHVPRGGA